MKFVKKYVITDNDVTDLVMPENAQILCCALSDGSTVLWVLQDSDEFEVTRRITSIETGADVGSVLTKADFLGTTQVGYDLAYHVFDLGVVV
jgi:hypothetical protein